MTAIGNDYGLDLVFARPSEALGQEDDVAIGITTSGNSLNVVQALKVAKAKSIFAVALSGSARGAVGLPNKGANRDITPWEIVGKVLKLRNERPKLRSFINCHHGLASLA